MDLDLHGKQFKTQKMKKRPERGSKSSALAHNLTRERTGHDRFNAHGPGSQNNLKGQQINLVLFSNI